VRTASDTSSSERVARSAEVRLANRLRQLRLDKALTLCEVASVAGMSQAYLSRVENHKVSLTIAGLEQLAAALHVPISVFFEQDSRTLPISICRREKGKRRRFRGREGLVFEMLASEKAGKLMEPLIVDLHSAKQPMPLKSHSGEEFNYVLEGECLLLYGSNRIRLREGDCVYYDASIPHAAHAISKGACRILAVVGSRDYLFHGDLSRLESAIGDGCS
jgi:transcriptional regulator with XRE-family HTH domain